MTTAAPVRAPTPRLKAAPVSSTTSESVTAVNSRPGPPAAQAQAKAQTVAAAPLPPSQGLRRQGRTGIADPLSDKATSFLIRRTLCPQEVTEKDRQTPAPIHDILHPLTSRNDVDLQLYAIIAIIIREFVQNWYNKITPDETFVAEIVQIIAHCTRALEQRLREVDLESLLFDELPELLDSHVQAYRVAHQPAVRPPIEVDPREIYHSLCPLPSLSPVPRPDDPQTIAEQAENETAYRQLLVRGVLAVLLPTEDLENDCLTALVGQIFSELIIGGVVARKASEPWLILEGLCILSRVIRQKITPGAAARDDSRSQGMKLSTAQERRGFSIRSLFWSLLQLVFITFGFLKFLVASVAMSRTPPSRRRSNIQTDEVTRQKAGEPFAIPSSADGTETEPVTVPIVAFRIWPALANLIEMDVRMPWVHGTLSLLQWLAMTGPGHIAGLDGVLDRLISHYIHRTVLDPSQLPPLLRSLRGALFPNNAMGKPTLIAPSSDAELMALRRKCANALWALVPRGVGRLYFGAGGGLSLFAPRSGPTNGQSANSVLVGGHPGLGRHPEGPATVTGNATATPTGSAAASGVTATAQGRGRGQGETQSPAATNAAVGRNNSERNSASIDSGGRGTDAIVDEDGGDEEQARILSEIESGVLDLFSDAYCNKHLMYSAIELILVRLMPELAEKGIIELWDERLS